MTLASAKSHSCVAPWKEGRITVALRKSHLATLMRGVIDTATTSALATRLPAPTTGKQTTFVNNSSMSILVFPSVTGGEINGVVDGYASIPNDGHPYVFSCVENPLPGAWVWSPPATGQIQLPTISVAHTNGTATAAYGVGTAGAQLINPTGAQWYDNISVSGFPTLTFKLYNIKTIKDCDLTLRLFCSDRE